jgi:hypothetical protein
MASQKADGTAFGVSLCRCIKVAMLHSDDAVAVGFWSYQPTAQT